MDGIRQPLDGDVMWLKTEITTFNGSLKYNMRIITDLGYSLDDVVSLDFTNRRSFIVLNKMYTPHNGHLKQILSKCEEIDTPCNNITVMMQYDNPEKGTVIGQMVYFSSSPS